jgi:hypothetical protein
MILAHQTQTRNHVNMPKKAAAAKRPTFLMQNVNQPGLEQPTVPLLPADLFPGGSTSGWWLKGVQLDLEARSLLIREATKPLRWRRT